MEGLLSRWRFLIPSDYEGVVRWGVGPPGASEISFEAVRRPIRHGPVQLIDGPEVEWIGGHNPLSISLSAYIVIDGDPRTTWPSVRLKTPNLLQHRLKASTSTPTKRRIRTKSPI